VRRNSTVCRFFCKGYSGPHAPRMAMALAFTSKGCFAPGVCTSVPSTFSDVPTPALATSL